MYILLTKTMHKEIPNELICLTASFLQLELYMFLIFTLVHKSALAMSLRLLSTVHQHNHLEMYDAD
jgi:membrane protein YqaA with SNARE-associated domain